MARLRTLHPLTPLLALLLSCPPGTSRAVPIVTSGPSVGGTRTPGPSRAYDSRPTPEQIAEARRRIGGHRMFVTAGAVELEFRHATLDTLGIHFGAGEPRAATATDSAGTPHPMRSEWLPLSPLSWDHVDRIEVQKPRGLECALIGGGCGVVAVIAWVQSALQEDGSAELGLAAPYFVLIPVAGAGLGALIGSVERKRAPVIWRNATPLVPYEWAPDDGEDAAGSAAPADTTRGD